MRVDKQSSAILGKGRAEVRVKEGVWRSWGGCLDGGGFGHDVMSVVSAPILFVVGDDLSITSYASIYSQCTIWTDNVDDSRFPHHWHCRLHFPHPATRLPSLLPRLTPFIIS